MKFIIVFYMFCSIRLFAQPALDTIYGTETANSGYTIIPEQNGYFISGAGYATEYNRYSAIKLYRVDSLGTVLWEKDFGKKKQGFSTGATGGCAKQTDDKGYITPGSFRDSATGIFTALILKVDSVGDSLWMDTFTFGNFTIFNDGVVTSDKGFAAIGQSNGLGDTSGNIYVVKVDSNGNFLWQKTYGGIQENDGYKIGLMPDGGFILSGFTASIVSGTTDNYLIRTDGDGNVIWSRTYGDSGEYNGACLAQPAIEGGFIMFGSWDTSVNGSGGQYIAKLDTAGNIKWITFLNDSISPYQIRELNNGGIVAVGAKDKSPAKGLFYGGYIAIFDSTGQQLWDTLLVYDGSALDTSYTTQAFGEFYDVQPTRNNGFALTGTANFVDTLVQNIQEIWLVKIGCVDDCDTVGIVQVSQSQVDLKIYPNPAYSSVIIEWQTNGASEGNVVIYDMLGRVVGSQQINSGKAEVNVSGLQDGLYVVRVLGNDGEVLGNSKLAVMR